MIDLYKNIKAKRIELGLSQEDLAKRMGYTDRSTIAKIEAGRTDLPVSKISEFAKALNTTEMWLMGWEQDTRVDEICNRLESIMGDKAHSDSKVS